MNSWSTSISTSPSESDAAIVGRGGADLLRHWMLDPVGKTLLVRVSAQLYNTRGDYERLAEALLTLL